MRTKIPTVSEILKSGQRMPWPFSARRPVPSAQSASDSEILAAIAAAVEAYTPDAR